MRHTYQYWVGILRRLIYGSSTSLPLGIFSLPRDSSKVQEAAAMKHRVCSIKKNARFDSGLHAVILFGRQDQPNMLVTAQELPCRPDLEGVSDPHIRPPAKQ